MGSFGYLMGINSCDLVIILAAILTLLSQLNYYYNQRNGIKPTFLRVFNMMSGLVTPNSIGLIEGKDIKKLLKIGKLFKIIIFNNNIVFPILGFILMFGLYFSFTKPIETLLYGIPNSMLLSLFVLYVCNICFTQMFYFYIICLYLKIKINSLNERLIEMNRSKQFMRIRGILKAFDSLYVEINEYNTTFWSKFLFAFWLSLGSIWVLMLYINCFAFLPFLLKMIFFYTLIISGIFFLFVIFTASSINYTANKTHKIFNSFTISYSKNIQYFTIARISIIAVKLKVKYIFLLAHLI